MLVPPMYTGIRIQRRGYIPHNTHLRVMRVPFPIDLIRQMDELILAGTGGYATRAEFIIDAIQERIVELSISEEEDAGVPSPRGHRNSSPTPDPSELDKDLVAVSPEPSSLTPIIRGYAISADLAASSVAGDSLFGLHNRDYPSLWGLNELARMTQGGPISVEGFYESVIRAAWIKGEELLKLERQSGRKCTALFPTNSEKKAAAELGFRMFGVGAYRWTKDGSLLTTGPLFEWRVAAINRTAEDLVIGVTPEGWKLLDECRGLSVTEPHPVEIASSFLSHLEIYAPTDHSTLMNLLEFVGPTGSSRDDLLEAFRAYRPDWSPNEVSTNAAGYVARAREWGLLQHKQIKGLYQLTDFGLDRLERTRKELA